MIWNLCVTNRGSDFNATFRGHDPSMLIIACRDSLKLVMVCLGSQILHRIKRTFQVWFTWICSAESCLHADDLIMWNSPCLTDTLLLPTHILFQCFSHLALLPTNDTWVTLRWNEWMSRSWLAVVWGCGRCTQYAKLPPWQPLGMNPLETQAQQRNFAFHYKPQAWSPTRDPVLLDWQTQCTQ